jgi:hypothetical protein
MKLDEIRARLKTLQEGRPKSKRWKPKDEHQVRTLPLPGEEDLATVVKWHYGVDGGRQMYCPTTDGNECAFCDFVSYLRSWKDENGKDKTKDRRDKDWETIKKLDAATKHYVPIVVRKKDSTDVEGPFLWEMTPKVYQELLKICTNDDRNEDHPDGGALRVLTSIMHGVDLTVSLKKANTPGNTTSYDKTEVEPRIKSSHLVKGDRAAGEALVARIPSIDEVAKAVSSEEAQRVFDAWMSGSSATPADSGDAGVEHASNSAETAAAGGGSVDDVIKRLEGMLGDDQPKA